MRFKNLTILSYTLLSLSILALGACTDKKKIQKDSSDVKVSVDTQNEPVQEAPRTQPTYNATETMQHDLIHTKLDVKFDWNNRQLLGKAELTLVPYFYPQNTLALDAKAMDIHAVKFVGGNYDGQDLEFTHDGWVLDIKLPTRFTRNERYTIFIDYTANPEEVEQKGSAAISEAKGLYFINHDNSIPNKNQEIWTQGETESSSTWFPTIDIPNEKTTQEISITVQDRFQTLSNGLKTSSVKNEDGTRTDTWKMDLPHAPYLFMMAVGEFSIVEDSWVRSDGSKMDVNYYVEEKYAPHAKAIFGKTPKMLSYFSDLLGVEYPWPKYSQVVVRDYVSGAMENTTATIHGDFLYQTMRELIDDNNESIIAHELFHHWFGDLVTCESWANLPLNESFANYSQYLWDEYEHGPMEADKNAYAEMDGYFLSAQQGGHVDMIRYDYNNKEEMFDGHSYNKGGRILHMLRTYIGDDAFFLALKNYLSENKFTATEIHELRMHFEKVSGKDLNWFFNQWFLASGHPIVKIKKSYDAEKKELTVMINQNQDLSQWPLYQLPVKIDIYPDVKIIDGNVREEQVWIKDQENTFVFKNVEKEPKLVNVDASKTTLWVKSESKSKEEWLFQLRNAPLWLDKKEAIDQLSKYSDDEIIQAFAEALEHQFYDVRLMTLKAIRKAASKSPETIKPILASLIKKDENSSVRALALKQYAKYLKNDASLPEMVEIGLADSSYKVNSAALTALSEYDADLAAKKAREMQNVENAKVNMAVARVLSTYGEKEDHDYFKQNITELNGMNKFGFLQSYFDYLSNQDPYTAADGIPVLTNVIETESMWFVKLAGYQTLTGLQVHFDKEASNYQQALDSDNLGGLGLTEMEIEKRLNFSKSQSTKIGTKLSTLKEKETDPNLLKYMPK